MAVDESNVMGVVVMYGMHKCLSRYHCICVCVCERHSMGDSSEGRLRLKCSSINTGVDLLSSFPVLCFKASVGVWRGPSAH